MYCPWLRSYRYARALRDPSPPRWWSAVTRVVPFTPLEEAVYNLESTFEPWNVQLELPSTERIDAARLTEAVRTAAGHHPLARARRRQPESGDTAYTWEIPADPPAVDVESVAATDLADYRTRFYGERIDLSLAPPFRVALVREGGVDGGDRVLFCTSHVPMDGVATLQFARSTVRAYRGDPLESPPGTFAERRTVLDDLGSNSVTDRIGRALDGLSRVTEALDEPTRIATDGEADEPGWGFHHRELDATLVDRLVGDRPDGVSVNDAMLAALHLAIDDWNDGHGERSRRISLMMPVNARPSEWFYEGIGMYAPFVSVTTHPSSRRDPARTLRKVARQTRQVKRRDGAAWVTEALDLFPPWLPVGAKRAVPRLLETTDYRFLDTAVLSNLGRVPSFPGFEAESPAELWFSPPTMMPMGVGVGVATHEGALRLSVRYSRRQFDAAAAERFTDAYVERLGGVV